MRLRLQHSSTQSNGIIEPELANLLGARAPTRTFSR